MDIPEYLYEEQRLHELGTPVRETHFRSVKRGRPAFHFRNWLWILRVKIDPRTSKHSKAWYEIIDGPDQAFQDSSYHLDFLFGDRKPGCWLQLKKILELSWRSICTFAGKFSGRGLWLSTSSSISLIHFYSELSAIRRRYYRNFSMRFLNQLLYLTVACQISPTRLFSTTPLLPRISANGSFKRFTRSVRSMWLQYLISTGNACICGSWLKTGSLLHRWTRPEILQGKRTVWLCVSTSL